mmetsp:Transcript_6791/g.10755  ORF Transcript_6791/g.10755 Transcript_6791/m.10755 type:complete len:83 (+) Transcript_6791:80-328(+)
MLSRVCYSGISKKEQLLRVTYVNVHTVTGTYMAKQCGNVKLAPTCVVGVVHHRNVSGLRVDEDECCLEYAIREFRKRSNCFG